MPQSVSSRLGYRRQSMDVKIAFKYDCWKWFQVAFSNRIERVGFFFFLFFIYIFALCRAQHEFASEIRESKRCNNNNKLGCWDVLCVFIFWTWISFAIFLDWYMIVWQWIGFVVINCVRRAQMCKWREMLIEKIGKWSFSENSLLTLYWRREALL